VIPFLVGCAAIACAVVAEIVFPGRALFQYGWYNALLAGAAVLCAIRAAALARGGYALPAVLAIAGTGTLAIAGIANGLFAPEPSLAIGAPGSTVRNDDLRGALVFPLSSTDPIVRLVRGDGTADIGPAGERFAGAFALWQEPRDVVAVDVSDARGAHLTVTQPSGNSFLSPVLTMPTMQNVAGMTLPFDTFAVPAAHRIVKAVLFDPRHAAMLRTVDAAGKSAVLFAVDDEEDRPVVGGLGMAIDGRTTAVGGLRVRPLVMRYPAIRIAPVPLPLAVGLGFALLLGAIALGLSRRNLDGATPNT